MTKISIVYSEGLLERDEVVGMIYFDNTLFGRIQVFRVAWPEFKRELEAKGVEFRFSYGV